MQKLEPYDLKFKLFNHINDDSSSLDYTQNNDTDPLTVGPYVKDNLLKGKEKKKIDKTVYEVKFDNKPIAFFVLSSSIIFENNKTRMLKRIIIIRFFLFY